MIRFARVGELNDLRSLFQECFNLNLTSPYGSFYITNMFYSYPPLVYICKNKIVSMLTLIPVSLKKNQKNFAGFYIWALGTLKDYRNKNIASEMLSFVLKYSKEQGVDFNILIPQGNNKDLYNFYLKRGFKIKIKHKIILLNKNKLSSYTKEEDKILEFETSENILNLLEYRKKNYLGIDFVEWSEKELIKIQKEITLPGSNNYILDFKDSQYAVLDFTEDKNNKIKIREFYIFDFNIGGFVKTLLNKYSGCEFFEFSLPICHKYCNFLSEERFVLKDMSMVRFIDDKLNKSFVDSNEIYFNFGFDT